jgi:LuxR family transcriptional regulator, maltose regulon positive regulatory protein
VHTTSTVLTGAASAAVEVGRPGVPRRTRTLPDRPSRHLARPELERRIRQGAAARLLLVTGPAGQGKTVTVAEALREATGIAWVSLDATDHDPARLWNHVLSVLDEACGGERTVVGTRGPEDALALVCGHLETLDEEVVLVVDAGTVAIDGEAARLLGLVLDWAPSNLHVVVLARRRPVIAVERRRAGGEVAELDADDLAFTTAEADAHLTGTWRLPLGHDTAASLGRLAEGWPVGIELVARQLAVTSDVETTAHRLLLGSTRAARDLVREMLDDLSEADRRFLLDLSALHVLDPDLCALVSERSEAPDLLRDLADRGLLVATGGRETTYRHRRLLHGPLRDELRTGDLQRERAHHAVAAAWFGERGAWPVAVEEARESGDHPYALDLLDDHLVELLRIDGGTWLLDTLARFPDDAVATHPRLLTTQADVAMLHGDRDLLEHLLGTIEGPNVDATNRGDLWRWVHAYLSRLRGDGVEPLLFHRGTRAFDPVTAYPLGVALAAEGRHDAAGTALRLALEDARRRGDALRELGVLADLAWERAVAGYIVDADLLCRRASDLAEVQGLPAPPLHVRLARAQIALDRGRTDVAREEAAAVRAGAGSTCDLVLRADVDTFISRARWAHGDVDGAVRALDDLERDLSDLTPGGGLVARIAAVRAGLCLAVDDVDGVLAPLSTITGAVDDLPPEDRLIAAMAHLRRGAPDRAHELVESLRDVGVGPRLSIHALRIQALAVATTGDALRAADMRRQADRIARVAGLLNPVMHRRVAMPSVTSGSAFRSPDDTLAPPPSAPSSPSGFAVEELTPREVAVLRMLPTSTNGEIATQLYVSVNTVKTHLKNIYRKLDVASRAAAVQRGRAFGIM